MGMMDQLLLIRVNYKRTVILINIQNNFLSSYKNIILTFGLIKAGFLSSYINIILIFGLIRPAFLSSYIHMILIFGLNMTTFNYFFVLVYIKWCIMNIIHITISLQK